MNEQPPSKYQDAKAAPIILRKRMPVPQKLGDEQAKKPDSESSTDNVAERSAPGSDPRVAEVRPSLPPERPPAELRPPVTAREPAPEKNRPVDGGLADLVAAIKSRKPTEGEKPSSVRVTLEVYSRIKMFGLRHKIRPMGATVMYLLLANVNPDGSVPDWVADSEDYDSEEARPLTIPIRLDRDLKERVDLAGAFYRLTITELTETLTLKYLPEAPKMSAHRRTHRSRRG